LQSFLIQVPRAKPMVVVPKGMLWPWAQEFKKWEVEEIPIFDLYEANSVESQLTYSRNGSSKREVSY
jgi:DNA repair and recombination RAD54-like protein